MIWQKKKRCKHRKPYNLDWEGSSTWPQTQTHKHTPPTKSSQSARNGCDVTGLLHWLTHLHQAPQSVTQANTSVRYTERGAQLATAVRGLLHSYRWNIWWKCMHKEIFFPPILLCCSAQNFGETRRRAEMSPILTLSCSMVTIASFCTLPYHHFHTTTHTLLFITPYGTHLELICMCACNVIKYATPVHHAEDMGLIRCLSVGCEGSFVELDRHSVLYHRVMENASCGLLWSSCIKQCCSHLILCLFAVTETETKRFGH